MAIAYGFDLAKLAGAHPFWSKQVVIIGAPIGLILGLIVIRLPYTVRSGAFLVLTILSGLVSYWGKTAFAASYAENVLAGQAWYFGWYGICIFAASLLTSMFTQRK